MIIRDLVGIIAHLTGFEGKVRWQADGQPRRQLDTTRAYEKFGFRAKTSLEDGLRKTIDWFTEGLESGVRGLESKAEATVQ